MAVHCAVGRSLFRAEAGPGSFLLIVFGLRHPAYAPEIDTVQSDQHYGIEQTDPAAREDDEGIEAGGEEERDLGAVRGGELDRACARLAPV